MKQGKSLLAVLMVLVLAIVSACSGNNGNSTGNNQSTNSPSATPDNGGTEEEAAVDPLGKYEAPIKLTMAVQRTAQSFVEGETDEDNRWIKEYQDALGIDVDVLWAMPSNQYFERLGVTIATGDLPDVMGVDAVTLAQLVESDMIEDLTEVYDKYASDLLKSIMDLDGNGYAWKQATFDGKLMAAPERSASLSGKMIHIRKDWLDNLGLQPPTTMDELLELIRAFTHDDPDRNGKHDTVGIAASKDIVIWNLDLSGFLNGYNAYAKSWVKGADGKLVYGSTLPEVREALLQLQVMYKDGQIAKEFGVKDVAAVTDDGSAGKYGIAFGSLSKPISPFQNVKKLDPNFDLVSVPLITITGEPAKAESSAAVNTFFVVRKGYEHPEALIKMQNLFADIWFGKQSNRYAEMITGEVNGNPENFFQYAPVKATNQGKNSLIHDRMVEALNGRLPVAELNTEEKTYYDLITAYDGGSGDPAGWAYKRVFGEGSSLAVQKEYMDKNLFQINEFYGLPTETMTTRWSTLPNMENELFPRIIIGESIESFDKFVADWNNLGGKEITEEVNAWYEANQ